MQGAPQRRLSRSGWVSLGLAVVVACLAWVSFDASRVDDADARSATELARMVQARSVFEREAAAVFVHHLLVGIDVDSDAVAAAAAWDRAMDAVDELRAIADGDRTDDVAVRARMVVEALDEVGIADLDGVGVEADSAELSAVYTAIDDIRWADERLPGTTRLDAAFELSFVASLPDQILVEALAAWTSVEGRDVDPELRDIYDEVTVVVRNDGGWLAEDPPFPLADSEWFDVTRARVEFPRATAAFEEALVATDLVELDAWMRDLGSSTTPAPVSLDDAVPTVLALRAEFATAVDALIADEAAAATEHSGSRPVPDDVLVVLAFLGALAALALFVGGVRQLHARRRSVQRLSDLALRDALTGAGNRHSLDPHTRAALADTNHRHHAIVVVDLDRFKMINDVFGHLAGDAVLAEVAERLRCTVAGVVAAAPGSVGHVVRMGGDEFLVSLHAPADLPVDLLVARLDTARRQSFEVAVDDRVEQLVPEFSYGVVECEGRGDLDELVVTADLAAYADKSQRSARRRIGADVEADDPSAASEPVTTDPAAPSSPSR